MKITFKQVDAFRTVVSTGTVTEAAEMLGISQPAVSRLISDFEAAVGFQLFQRVGRVLEPTEEARLLVAEVRQAVSGMEHIKEAAGAIRNFGHARLTLVTTPTFSTLVAPNLVGQFASKRPDSMLKMEIGPADDAVEWMVSQSYDFGITTSETLNPTFDSLMITNDDVYCVVPEGHPLSEKTLIHARDLAEESFISYISTSRFRFEIDNFFDSKGVTRKLQYETRTTDAICRLVATGLGVSVVGSSAEYLKSLPGVVALPFAAPLTFRAVLIWSNRRPLSAIAQEFLEIARENVDRKYP
ncbi:MAG: LysR family transcriptional regulator [Rhodobacteraceae bacterium]|nr:LysR family transcriptional regulator [Paracoccaceae bacterium]